MPYGLYRRKPQLTPEAEAMLRQATEDLIREGKDHITLTIRREEIQEGRTFSLEAMQGIVLMFQTYLAARMQAYWGKTGVPPTLVKIDVQLEIH